MSLFDIPRIERESELDAKCVDCKTLQETTSVTLPIPGIHCKELSRKLCQKCYWKFEDSKARFLERRRLLDSVETIKELLTLSTKKR